MHQQKKKVDCGKYAKKKKINKYCKLLSILWNRLLYHKAMF